MMSGSKTLLLMTKMKRSYFCYGCLFFLKFLRGIFFLDVLKLQYFCRSAVVVVVVVMMKAGRKMVVMTVAEPLPTFLILYV
jgi:hypothetical protein